MTTTSGTSLLRHSPAQPAGQPTPARVTVAVMADDLLSGDGITAHLRDQLSLRVLPPQHRVEADVVVIVAVEVTEQLLDTTSTVHDEATNPNQCTVLVADTVPARFMTRILACGVVSVLPRNGATATAVAQVVVASAHGRSVLSPVLTRALVDHCRDFEQVVRTNHGIVPGGLTTREVDIVRCLAEGMSTVEIATRIPYSERTIKNILQELLTRMNFRNRTEAVAYAFRVGAL